MNGLRDAKVPQALMNYRLPSYSRHCGSGKHNDATPALVGDNAGHVEGKTHDAEGYRGDCRVVAIVPMVCVVPAQSDILSEGGVLVGAVVNVVVSSEDNPREGQRREQDDTH